MNEITSAQFIQRLLDGHRIFPNFRVTDEVSLTQEHFNHPDDPNDALAIEIVGCQFDRSLVFNKIDLGYGLHIKDTTIKEDLKIEGCWSEQDETKLEDEWGAHMAILFENLNVSGKFFIGGNSAPGQHSLFHRSLLIREKCKFSRFIINGVEFSRGEIFIKDSKFSSNIGISWSPTLNGIHLEECKAGGVLSISHCNKISSLPHEDEDAPMVIKTQLRQASVSLYNFHCQRLSMSDCEFSDGLLMELISTTGDLKVKNCDAVKDIGDPESPLPNAVIATDLTIKGNFEFTSRQRPKSTDRGYYGDLDFSNIEVHGRTHFDQQKIIEGALLFSGKCHFHGKMEVSASLFVRLLDRITNNIHRYGIRLNGATVGDTLKIWNCTFDEKLGVREIEEKDREGFKAIELRKSHIYRLSLLLIDFSDNDLRLHEVTVERSLRLTLRRCAALIIDDSEIGQKTLLSANLSFLEITNSKFGKQFTATEGLRVSGNTRVEGSVFQSGAELELQTQKLELKNVESDQPFNVLLASTDDTGNPPITPSEFNIVNGKLDNNLEIDLNGNEVASISKTITSGFKGLSLLKNGKTGSLTITGLMEAGTLRFDELAIGNLSFQSFQNSSQIIFTNNKILGDGEGNLSFISSILGTMVLTNFRFKHFRKIEFNDSLVEGIEYSNVDWFERDKVVVKQGDPSSIVNTRDFYRQLKQAAEKNGDRVQALRFKADEFRFYQKVLTHELKIRLQKLDRGESDRYEPRLFFKLLGDKISLLFSKWSNDYGLNWLLPFGWAMLFTLLAWHLMIISMTPWLDYTSIFGEQSDTVVKHMGSYWSQFFQLFNPARYLSRVFDFENHPELQREWPLYLIDVVHRLVLGFLIYQVISAFRKYFK